MKKIIALLLAALLGLTAALTGLTALAATVPQAVCRVDGETYTTVKAENGTVTLPEAPAGIDQIFVGWHGKQNGATVFLPTGASLSIGENITLDAVYVKFKTLSKPEVRVKEGDVGLRFITEIDRADYDALKGLVGEDKISLGTYIVAGDYLAKKNKEDVVKFTIESLASRGFTKYIDIPRGSFTKETSTTLTYTGAVVNILKGNYTREYAGIGYLKVVYSDGNEGTVYCQYRKTDHRHSIYKTVFAAFNDRNPNYQNLIIEDENGLSHSPYTKEQLDAMKAFINRCVALSFNERYDTWYVNRNGAYYPNPLFSATYDELNSIITVTPTGSATPNDIWGISIGGTFFELGKAEIKDGKLTYRWSNYSSRQ